MKPLKRKRRGGVCKFCGCTNARPCVLSYECDGTPEEPTWEQNGVVVPINCFPVACSWFTVERDVCTKASCVETYLKEQRGQRRAG